MVFDPEELDSAFTAQYSTTTSTNTWFIDSGASNHVTGSKDHFTNYIPINSQQLKVANGQRLPVKGKGDLKVPEANGLSLTGMWHVPGMMSNLVSLGQLED